MVDEAQALYGQKYTGGEQFSNDGALKSIIFSLWKCINQFFF